MSENKIYCGSGKEFGQYGQVNASICLDDIPAEHITKGNNGKRYVNIKVCKKREPDQWGKTHYLEIDTWRPNQAPQQAPTQTGYQPPTEPPPAFQSQEPVPF